MPVVVLSLKRGCAEWNQSDAAKLVRKRIYHHIMTVLAGDGCIGTSLQKFPDSRVFDLRVFQIACDGHGIACDLGKALFREVAAARVAD